MNAIYFDCCSGISGDMCLGALLDAGLPLETLQQELSRLNLSGFELDVRQVRVQGISATDVSVKVNSPQPSRHLHDIILLLESSSLAPDVVQRSKAVFRRLAEAEGAVHGIPAEQVHFHEVGAVDAIVDVVGTVAGLASLGVEQVWVSPLPLASGWVQSAHGLLPLPAPATAHLLQGVPVYGTALRAELVTPTGAAIVSTLADGFGPLPAMTLGQVGYGAGKRSLAHPNLLRVFTGEIIPPAGGMETDTVSVVETQIDDMNPELFGSLWEALFNSGALDVMMNSVQMKKGRPGTKVTVLCHPEKTLAVSQCLLRETTSTGVRWREERRYKASRQVLPVDTPWGAVRVKFSSFKDAAGRNYHKAAPEFEDCRQVARASAVPVKTVYDTAQSAAIQRLQSFPES
ncbi:hypothetical protein SY88_07710 [Clostridiales bacterium PH28_bin88]|nr:hypothetical protein SY88_07710 [Clostridiales bacterium PH28_bin88]